MGVTGGLVRSLFFRNKSFGSHDFNNGRRRWSSVRSYLCGHEFNSVLAVDDSGSIKDSVSLLTMSHQLSSDYSLPFDSVLAIEDSASVKLLEDEKEDSGSVKSSEATVTQPLQKLKLLNSYVREATEKHQTTQISNLFLQEDAAVIIQTAFRSHLATCRRKEGLFKEESFSGEESQGKLSMGTSLEVQTCSSVKTPFFRRKRASANRRIQHKVLRIKEDWDDSTVSSTISKSRTQNRIEAMTKRERALAYAFSQQLRICSKKKQIDNSSEDKSNIGWSWLERWMATRVPDSIPNELRTDKNQSLVRKNRSFGGELESCASNDLPIQFESISETVYEKTKDFQTEKNNHKASISVPRYKSQRKHNKFQTIKRDLQQETNKAKKAKTIEENSQNK